MTDPTTPQELGSYSPGENTVAVAAGDGIAYLSSWYGLHVLDVSDPRSPRLVGWLAAVPNRFAVVGKLAYVAEDGMGLSIIDLADPTQPVRLGSVELPYDYPFDVTVEGSHAFVADGGAGVQVCDVSDPHLPRLIAGYALDGDIAATAHGVAVAQGVMCVAEWPNRVHVANVTNLQNPVRIAIYDEIAHAMKCPLFGGRVFLGGYTPGIQTIDVSNPADPTRLSTFAATRVAAAEVDRTYAYVAEHSDGLTIYDVTDPAAPRFVSRFPTAESAMQARRYGDLVYLADHRAGVAILDVRDPTAPSLVSLIPAERAMDVLLLGVVLYVADAREGLISIDVSNPAAPIRLATLPVRGQPHCVIQVGPYLYVGGAVNVVDISDPANPFPIACVQTTATVQRMVLVNERVYLTSSRLRVLDVSDPAAPRWLGSYQPRGPWIDDLAVSDGFVYLAAREGGLEIVRAADVVVGPADLAVLLSAYGSCADTGDQYFNSYADLDDSGCIDFHDLVLLLASFGQ